MALGLLSWIDRQRETVSAASERLDGPRDPVGWRHNLGRCEPLGEPYVANRRRCVRNLHGNDRLGDIAFAVDYVHGDIIGTQAIAGRYVLDDGPHVVGIVGEARALYKPTHTGLLSKLEA